VPGQWPVTTGVLAEPAKLPEAVAAPAARRPPAALVAAGLVVAAVFALPLLQLLRENASGFVSALRAADATAPLRRTLALAVTVSAGAVVVGTALAWLLVRTDLPARRVLRVVAPLPLVIPSYVGALALLAATAPGGLVAEVLGLVGVDRPLDVRGFSGSVLVLVLLTYPYVYLPVAARLATLPGALEESARSLGRAPREVFREVVLPQLWGAMGAGALLVFLYSLSEFGAVALLRYDTLTRVIFSAKLFEPEISLALSLLLAAIAIAVVAAERALARRRRHVDATAGSRTAPPTALGRWRLPALGFVAGVLGCALVLPVAVLVQWVLRGVLGNARLDAGRLSDPFVTSAWVAIVTAGVAVAVVMPVAYLTTRYRSRAGDAAGTVVVAGFAVPGLVLALTLVALVRDVEVLQPLYLTYTLLVVAYTIHFGSQALRASQVAVAGVPDRVVDAARSLGAGRVRRFARVELPLMRSGLAAGAGLVLLSTLKELPATLVLAPLGVQTLATQVWSATSEGFYAQAGLAALVLLALSAALTWVLTVRPLAREIR
jgi:iron(III) transport system permease protein